MRPLQSGTTVQDVARSANVSRQTVSNVLNAPHRVQPETRRRVEMAITHLGYRPNRAARSLRQRSSRVLGYRIDAVGRDAINPVLDRFLHALSEAARQDGYLVLVFTPDEEHAELATYAEMIATNAVDGFVVSGTEYDDERAAWLAQQGVPFVTFGRTGPASDHAWVDVDGEAGTAGAVSHLVERGHRRIAFLGWPTGSVAGDFRAAGWRRGLTVAGLAVDPSLDVRAVNGFAGGARATAGLLERVDRPTAIVATSDLLAAGAMAAARAAGLAVGPDIGIVGFDDTSTAPLLDPGLTSVRQPIEEVGREVVRALTSALAGNPPQPAGVLLEPELVVRASTDPRAIKEINP